MGRAQRRKFLKKHPYCRMCQMDGKKTRGEICMVGHSLCMSCFEKVMASAAYVPEEQTDEETSSENSQQTESDEANVV